MPKYDLAIIGGGAAGFFGAIQAAERQHGIRIVILEKSSKVLAKVRVSGGGRCNVTNYCFNPFDLAGHYPRGEKQLKILFKEFQARDMVAWLQDKGVALKAEEDNRMFPTTDSSETIIECFIQQVRQHNIAIELQQEVLSVLRHSDGFRICCSGGEYLASTVLIAVGGNPKGQFYSWIRNLGHTIVQPIPSLFTFNDDQKSFTSLMGVSVPNATVRIATTKFIQQGPVLITHWGLSGPAVIKLSSWAARWLHEKNYEFTASVNWLGEATEDQTRFLLNSCKTARSKQRVRSNPAVALPARLWEKLCDESEIEEGRIWGELSLRAINKLLEGLIRCPFRIKGKTTFKEEFVTCGGVLLDEIDLSTMGSRIHDGIYFAGEVLDIDGETGGFNFQSAWTTAFVAARAIANMPGKDQR